jgi:phosphoribosylformylglycinamidine synthase
LAGKRGAKISNDKIEALFGEDQARYLVTCSAAAAEKILAEAATANIPASMVGETGGTAIQLPNLAVSLDEISKAHEGFFPSFMEKEIA